MYTPSCLRCRTRDCKLCMESWPSCEVQICVSSGQILSYMVSCIWCISWLGHRVAPYARLTSASPRTICCTYRTYFNPFDMCLDLTCFLRPYLDLYHALHSEHKCVPFSWKEASIAGNYTHNVSVWMNLSFIQPTDLTNWYLCYCLQKLPSHKYHHLPLVYLKLFINNHSNSR